jgi:hypothetical protein
MTSGEAGEASGDLSGPSDAPDDAEEWSRLASPEPPRRSPIVALCVIGLSAVVALHLLPDVRYAFVRRSPRALGEARSLAERGVELADNQYVTIRGMPDRINQLSVEPRGERTREGLFRLRADDRPLLLVRAAETARRLDLKEEWTGRLRRLGAMPYAESVAEYFAKETHATRSLDLASLRAALSGQPGALRDRTGRPVTLAADTPVTVDIARPHQLLIHLSQEKFPTADDARHELVQMGLSGNFVSSGGGSFDFYVFEDPPGRDALIAKLEERGLSFAPYHQRLTVPFRQLKLGFGGLLEAGQEAKTVGATWDAVQTVDWSAPIFVGENHDAWIVTEGEAPAQLWWAPLVAALLIAFAAFNLWYLVRARRRPV